MKLYKFYKQDCSPCNLLSKIIKMISLPENIELVEIDATENIELVSEFNITAVPVLAFSPEVKLVGVKSKPQIEEWIKSYGD